jgi:hypothetical protein
LKSFTIVPALEAAMCDERNILAERLIEQSTLAEISLIYKQYGIIRLKQTVIS